MRTLRFWIHWIVLQFATLSKAQNCIFNDTAGSGNILDLTALQYTALSGNDSEYNYIYTPCRNGDQCVVNGQTNTAMSIQAKSNQCAILANWDNGKIQPSFDSTEETWKFEYQNGAQCQGEPRRFYVYFNCDSSAGDYVVTSAGEITSCTYEMYIDSKWACPVNYTTTTTSTTTTTTTAPHESCIFESNDGEHTLNISSVAGNSLSSPDNDNKHLFYIYTPCLNTLKCDNNTLSMSYLMNTQTFHCEKYLAIWENGINKPYYNNNEQSWQFIYANGESCGGFRNTFLVYWICDTKRQQPSVTFAGEISQCVYQMTINSTLAC